MVRNASSATSRVSCNEMNETTQFHDKDLLAGLAKLRIYLLGDKKIIVYTYHAPFTHSIKLSKTLATNDKVAIFLRIL